MWWNFFVKTFRESHFYVIVWVESVWSLFSWYDTPTTCCHEDKQAKKAHKKSGDLSLVKKLTKVFLYSKSLLSISSFQLYVCMISLHIYIRHHFIREHVEHSVVFLEHMPTKIQLAELFTQPLDKERFKTLRMSIGMICVDWCLRVIVSGLMSKNFNCISLSLRATHLRSNDLKQVSCTWAWKFIFWKVH